MLLSKKRSAIFKTRRGIKEIHTLVKSVFAQQSFPKNEKANSNLTRIGFFLLID